MPEDGNFDADQGAGFAIWRIAPASRKCWSGVLFAALALTFTLIQVVVVSQPATAKVPAIPGAPGIPSPEKTAIGAARAGSFGFGVGIPSGAIANANESQLPVAAYRATPSSIGKSGSIETDHPFGRTGPIVSPGANAAVHAPLRLAEVKFSPRFESNLWEVIKDSANPAEFRTYLNVFPNGQFAAEAKQRLDDLRGGTIAGQPKEQPQAALRPAEIEMIGERYRLMKNIDLRAKPKDDAAVVGRMNQGEEILVVGRLVGHDWYKVSKEEGKYAYVPMKLLGDRDRVASTKPSAPATTMKAPVQRPPAVATASPATSPPAVPAMKIESFRDCPDCPEMIAVVGGVFQMGSDKGDGTEKPVRTVRIARRFAIGKSEITVAQWQACAAAKGCEPVPAMKKYKPDSPARKLSWIDVQEYVVWLSRKTGHRYRLPTEAEWEYAARGGSQTEYWWGDEIAGDKADCKGCGGTYDRKRPQPVGGDKANPFGLFGVSGGVWEWTADCWHKSYASAPAGAGIWDKPDCRLRVLRGGSWRNDASYARVASRFKYDFNVRYSTNGFRVARELR